MVITSFARWALCAALIFSVNLAGCTGASLKPEALPTVADRLMARDFAQIIFQIPQLPPATTVLRVPRPIGPIDSFDRALREELAALGYGIKAMSHTLTPDEPVVSHTLRRTASDQGELLEYTVTVAQAEFRRGYRIAPTGQVQPTTAMRAKGVEAANLRQDDTIFARIDEVAVASTAVDGSDPVDAQPIVLDPIGEELIVIPPVIDASRESALFDLRDTKIIDQSLLAFEGDSLYLGEVNKRRVRVLIDRFVGRSDVFSILGCIPSSAASWTDSVAEQVIGRTERVRSELLYAGIPAEKIIVEKCSDGSGFEQPTLADGNILLLLNRGVAL